MPRRNDALALLLTAHGCESSNEGVADRVSSAKIAKVEQVLAEIAAKPSISEADLRLKAKDVIRQEWDWVLPPDLLLRSFATSELDLQSVPEAARSLLEGRSCSNVQTPTQQI